MNIADLEIKRSNSNRGEDDHDNSFGPLIFECIAQQDWQAVQAICESNPQAATCIDPVSGRSPLHMACSIGSASPRVIEVVASVAPEMIQVEDKVYRDTPLHIVCRNSQTTVVKLETVLKYCDPEDILHRNVIGGTCLHSACGHNATFEVLKLIVEKNPSVLKISTFDGTPPIRGLFFSYTQSIPGVLAVGKILKGATLTDSGHFDRFWAKASYLALQYFRLSEACPPDALITNDHVAHGLIYYNAPLNLLKVALMRNPGCAQALDKDGNTCLHLLVERRPYRLKELDAIQSTLAAYPEAAAVANYAGQPPLIMAIRNKIPFEKALGEILKADMTAVSSRDTETNLFPFQLAASVGGPEALNTTFQLLAALPQVICS